MLTPSRIGPSIPSETFVLPPLTSWQHRPLTIDKTSAQNAATITGNDVPTNERAQTLGVPGQQDTDVDAAKTRNESIGRGSKRSLTGRRRDRSAGSRRRNEPSEKVPRTDPGEPPKSKRKSGFLAILCCSSSDQTPEFGSQEAAEPAKPVSFQQNTPARAQNAQNHSTTDTSVTQDTKDVDEKAAQNKLYADGSRSGTAATAADADRLQPSDGTADKSTSNVLGNPSGSDTRSPSDTNAPLNIVPPGSGSEGLTAPPIGIQPPTPTVPLGEDSPISDRTPHQASVDNELEAGDKALTGEEAEHIQDEQMHDPSDDSQTASTSILPPPPPASTSTISTEAPTKALLPALRAEHQGRKCLVLDLDETLVHSSFKVSHIAFDSSFCVILTTTQILHQADFTIPVEIEGQYHNVYVIKRPGVDTFLKRVGELYEVVVFTASVAKYGDPLLDQLDIHNVVHHRLFRESCYNHQGNYVKDLSQVGRDLKNTIIIDNSPTSYIFHPQHAVPISSWFSDAHDNELLDLIPVLEDLAGSKVQDVSLVLDVAL